MLLLYLLVWAHYVQRELCQYELVYFYNVLIHILRLFIFSHAAEGREFDSLCYNLPMEGSIFFFLLKITAFPLQEPQRVQGTHEALLLSVFLCDYFTFHTFIFIFIDLLLSIFYLNATIHLKNVKFL